MGAMLCLAENQVCRVSRGSHMQTMDFEPLSPDRDMIRPPPQRQILLPRAVENRDTETVSQDRSAQQT